MSGKVLITCDNKHALRVLKPGYIPDPKEPNFDLVTATWKILKEPPIVVTGEYVKGHQDDHLMYFLLGHKGKSHSGSRVHSSSTGLKSWSDMLQWSLSVIDLVSNQKIQNNTVKTSDNERPLIRPTPDGDQRETRCSCIDYRKYCGCL